MENSNLSDGLISALVLSIFEDDGPSPQICIPNVIEYSDQLLIAMKSISLLMGEQVYQEGKHFNSIKYFGILPFPDLHLTGLTYFFLIYDEEARGKAKASTICLLVPDYQSNFLYENMKQLSVFLAETAETITGKSSKTENRDTINNLFEKLIHYTNTIKSPISQTRNLKILFTGLDASGKTSFLKAVKQKYSELIGIRPTKGIERSEHEILGQNLLEWDIGGQIKYRKNFLRSADVYLFETNLMFYMVDIQDSERYDQVIEFFGEILDKLRSFDQYPPIIINFHKVDPDVVDNPEINLRITSLKKQLLKIGKDFNLNFANTSIFQNFTLIRSFSEGLNLLSPNRSIFKQQLKWLAREINAKAVILINDNSIILSDYAIDEKTGLVTEISAPHFQNLFKTFSEFELLKQNFVHLVMENDIILFFKLTLNEQSLYLLCLVDKNEEKKQEFNVILSEFNERIIPLIQTYL